MVNPGYETEEDDPEEEGPGAKARERQEEGAKSLGELAHLEHARERAAEDYKPDTPNDYESGTHGSTRRA